jgi:RNA polymerase sigma-70 factor (ECF subfamily)
VRDGGKLDDSRLDSEVVRASVEQPEAFEVIFDRHFDTIYGYLARRLWPDVADDLAADVFVAAFVRRSTFDSDAFESARPWLFGIASRLAARHARQAGRQARAYGRSPESGLAFLDTDAAADRIDAREMRSALVRAVGLLRPELRDVLLLVAVHGLSYAEASEALGVPLGTVQSRLSRARQRLRSQLEKEGARVAESEDGDQ